MAKRQAQALLSATVLPIAKGLSGYAAFAGNADLLRDAKLTPRSISREGDMALLGTAKRICDLATAHLPNLGPYGVTATMLADAAAKATSFSALIGTPAAAKRERAGHTKALEERRKAVVAVLRQLDLLIPLFESTASDLVFQYRVCRRLTKPGHRKRALQVRITDAAGKPIADAMLSIPSLKVKRKSTEKGQAYFQHLHPGSHVLRIDAAGYAMKEVPVIIVANERTVSDVMLVAE